MLLFSVGFICGFVLSNYREDITMFIQDLIIKIKDKS
jgi:hypothetical protein